MPDIAAARPVSGAPIESTWGGQMHDALEGVQAGSIVITSTAATTTDGVITFPRPYASAPAVIVSATGANTYFIQPTSLATPTQQAVRLFKRDGTAMTAGTAITAYWVAIGTPA